jgi:hypothetical protein
MLSPELVSFRIVTRAEMKGFDFFLLVVTLFSIAYARLTEVENEQLQGKLDSILQDGSE